MYIHIESFDGRTLKLNRGPGPLLVGHYSSASEWRIVSSILASVASHVPDTMVAILDDMTSPPSDSILGCGPWDRLTDQQLRDTARGGWLWLEKGRRGLFVPSNRDEIEDAVYRSFATGVFLIAPLAVRSSSPIAELEHRLQEAAVLEVDAAYFDIEVIIRDPSIAQLVVTSVTKIVAAFNQL